MRALHAILAVLFVLLGLQALVDPALADEGARARIVYFSSPTCPFCTTVSERDLAALEATHGERMELIEVDTSREGGQALLEHLWESYAIPGSRRGVPTAVIGDEVLVGAREIPERLPGLVERALSEGGTDFPSWPGLAAFEGHAPIAAPPDTWRDRLHRDVPGNYVALALLGVLVALGAAMALPRPWQRALAERTPVGVKVGVALVGLGTATYLSWVELTHGDLVCGPVGQCNVVQHSDMATLWGLFPVAVLGALGYATLLAIYALGLWGPERLRARAPLMILALSGPGFAFSVLLTFWQPFIIGATCAWCLVSATSMTLTCVLSLDTGRRQLGELLAPSA